MSNKLIEKILCDFKESIKKETLIGSDLGQKVYDSIIKEEYSKEKIEILLENHAKNENT